MSTHTHTRHRIKITTVFFLLPLILCRYIFRTPQFAEKPESTEMKRLPVAGVRIRGVPSVDQRRFNERRRAGAEGKRHEDLSEKTAGSILGYRKLTLKGFDSLRMLHSRHTGLRSVCGLVRTYVGIFKNAEVLLASGVK